MHVRRGRYLVDQTINNASGSRGEAATKKKPARRRCTLIMQGIQRVERYRHRNRIERRGHRGPDGPCTGAWPFRRRLLFAVLPLITH